MTADTPFRPPADDPSDQPLRMRISGPAELVEAIPYLLGFHPRDSVVLVGLADGQLVVTARLDIPDAPSALQHSVRAMARGGASDVIAVIYPEDVGVLDVATADALPMTGLAEEVATASALAGCNLLDVSLVTGQRHWSYLCDSPGCCPAEGRALEQGASAIAAAAVYAGMVALPDRNSLADQLTPLPAARRADLRALLGRAEDSLSQAILDGRGERHQRSVKRAIFAAARAASARRWTPPSDDEAARFGVALADTAVRDAVWTAIDDGRLDGRELWRDLARRLPEPYDAPALFLFGWDVWRQGEGTLAGMAAERAVASDPTYGAADLLLAALAQGLSPRRLPRLRRSA